MILRSFVLDITLIQQLYPMVTLKKLTFGVGNVIPLVLLYLVRYLTDNSEAS